MVVWCEGERGDGVRNVGGDFGVEYGQHEGV